MGPSTGLQTALNKMREMSVKEGSVYHQYVPIITDLTSIGEFGQPILEMEDVRNEFISKLVKRIAYTQITSKMFDNPLAQLEGEQVPLGYAGQSIFVNRAKGRQFDVSDFAGLLQRYESDIKVEYQTVNMDVQYPVTITRAKIKNAFVSWSALEEFINGITQSLYAGASIDQYNWTKALVSNAYRNGHTINQIINKPTDKASAEAFVEKARELFMNMQTPTSEYNAWAKVNTDDDKPIITWTNPEDVVFILRSDVIAKLDVTVMAQAFNISSASLYGKIIPVANFDMFNDEGEKVFDGSNILGIMADRAWFKIKSQDVEMDTFYNANNRTWQYYLNVVKMYNYSLFANAVVFATEEPSDYSY
jgi:hypothetical protein